jgi:hypothetical protein
MLRNDSTILPHTGYYLAKAAGFESLPLFTPGGPSIDPNTNQIQKDSSGNIIIDMKRSFIDLTDVQFIESPLAESKKKLGEAQDIYENAKKEAKEFMREKPDTFYRNITPSYFDPKNPIDYKNIQTKRPTTRAIDTEYVLPREERKQRLEEIRKQSEDYRTSVRPPGSRFEEYTPKTRGLMEKEEEEE